MHRKGDIMVELTSSGMGRDALALREIGGLDLASFEPPILTRGVPQIRFSNR